ncbi:MAG: GTP-binding protein EngB [Chitinophagaceae bacterium]|nr:GTP-binding protein EngB [Chitinophagaceae bacterium]
MIIKSASYLISSPEIALCPKPDRPEYAFIGRSNVGKSSLINMICNIQKLAKTSASPGKTQMINHFEIQSISKDNGPVSKWYLVDLPGYGYAKVSISNRKKWERMIEDYLLKRENLVNIFILIDSRHPAQAPDLDFINKLGKWNIPFTLVFTKTDKENQRTVAANIKSLHDGLRKTWQFLPRQFITSAIKKSGRDKILAFIEESNETYWEEQKEINK